MSARALKAELLSLMAATFAEAASLIAGAALLVLIGTPAPCTAAAGDGSADCQLLLGVGATYEFWGWSEGIVVPVTLELDASRWELGAFRMARTQIATSYGPPDKTAAEPYWGFSAMRRWTI
jgi:hypothetical protein